MARVPIIRVGDTLIATVLEDLRDRDAMDLQHELGTMLERSGARGVLLDVSVVETIDSFLGRMLGETASLASLLGAHTILVGMQPQVAMTLVELGLQLKGIHLALDAERGMILLRKLLEGDDARGTLRGR